MKFAARGDLSQIFDLALGNCSGACPPELVDGMGPSWGLQLRGKRCPGGGDSRSRRKSRAKLGRTAIQNGQGRILG